MRLIQLNKKQVEYIYEKSMKVDFPEKERKPLAMILKGVDDGFYECLGAIEETEGKESAEVKPDAEYFEEITGYVIFVKNGRNYLFDYFAVMGNVRSKGLGSAILELIREYYKDADCVFGEVEDPAFAQNAEDESIQTRRLNFYLRNGYVDTGARCWLFGVNYIILELDLGKGHTKEEIKKIYKSHYKKMLPRTMYWTMVRMKK